MHAERLLNALETLSAGGCRRVWVNGSYVTDKDLPGDVDVVWDAWGVRPKDLDPIMRYETPDHRHERKKRFGGDYFPVYDNELDGALIRSFQTDRSDIPKGILQIELSSLPPQDPTP